METNEVTDAIGMPIVFGQRYGYSTRDGGWSTVTIGTAVNTTPKGKVTLQDLEIKRYLYGKPAELFREVPKSVSVTASQAFPVFLKKEAEPTPLQKRINERLAKAGKPE